MSLRTCADCSTRYALDLGACPHCGSSNTEDMGVVTRRLPLFVTVMCPDCGRGPWTVRLPSVHSGLIDLPTLACASCGGRVPVTWPPKEEPMSPKITAHGGATNAREADVSPVAVVSEPPVVAEDDGGRPIPEPEHAPEETPAGEDALSEDTTDDAVVDYDSMTLSELKEAAAHKGLPAYGTKAQITERLKEAAAGVSAE